jgi:hypothetical protein
MPNILADGDPTTVPKVVEDGVEMALLELLNEERKAQLADPQSHQAAPGAMLAIGRGDAAALSRYFREARYVDPCVLYALAKCLEGCRRNKLREKCLEQRGIKDQRCTICSGINDQKARFKIRNGKPPQSPRFDRRGTEGLLAKSLLSLARSKSPLPPQLRLMLANALDPDGKGKWKLKFSRGRKGRPGSPRRAAIKQATLGVLGLQMFDQVSDEPKSTKKTKKALWDEVRSRLNTNEADLKHAVAGVRRKRQAKRPRPKISMT